MFSYIHFKCFTFLFTTAKFDVYPCDATSSCITNLHAHLVCLELAKILVAQDGRKPLFFLDAG